LPSRFARLFFVAAQFSAHALVSQCQARAPLAWLSYPRLPVVTRLRSAINTTPLCRSSWNPANETNWCVFFCSFAWWFRMPTSRRRGSIVVGMNVEPTTPAAVPFLEFGRR